MITRLLRRLRHRRVFTGKVVPELVEYGDFYVKHYATPKDDPEFPGVINISPDHPPRGRLARRKPKDAA